MSDDILSQETYFEAKSYPFFRPNYPFLFIDGKIEHLKETSIGLLNSRLTALGSLPLSKLTPVLAYGANASPERLIKKFRSMPESVVIPVIPAVLEGFDIVFCCHFSTYGAIPATLQASPGTKINIAVNYLNDQLLKRMTETEIKGGNYTLGLLQKVDLKVMLVGHYRNILTYWSHRGCLSKDTEAIALKSVLASGRKFVEKDGKEILDIAQNLCHVDGPIEPFIKKIVLNLNYREDMNQILKNFAKPMEWPYLKV